MENWDPLAEEYFDLELNNQERKLMSVVVMVKICVKDQAWLWIGCLKINNQSEAGSAYFECHRCVK